METRIKRTIYSKHLDMSDLNDSDSIVLSNLLAMTCKRYSRMKAYENHWRVDYDSNRCMATYDKGVACLEANKQFTRSCKDYIRVLEDILVIDYGDLKTPVTLFSYKWKKRYDNFKRITYVRDADSFLVVNFKHNTFKAVLPYVFIIQCTQVFFQMTIFDLQV